MIFICAKIIDGTLVVLINERVQTGEGAWGAGLQLKPMWEMTVPHLKRQCQLPKSKRLANGASGKLGWGRGRVLLEVATISIFPSLPTHCSPQKRIMSYINLIGEERSYFQEGCILC